MSDERATDERVHASLQRDVLDPSTVVSRVQHAGAGAASVFIGTVRDVHASKRVLRIDYEAYDAMALRELHDVAREVADRHVDARVAIAHRIGTLEVGEASIVVAASHPHREAAIAACSEAIELVKRRVPVWKREHFADGTEQWVNSTARAGGAT